MRFLRELRSSRTRWWSFVGISAVGLLVSLAVMFAFFGDTPEELLMRAGESLENGEWDEAEALALRVLKKSPKSVEAWEIAANAATQARRYEAAISHFEKLFRDRAIADPNALVNCGKCQLALGQASDAEHSFRQALSLDPDHSVAKDSLFYLLEMECRTWDARPLLTQFIQNGHINDRFLILSTSINEFVRDEVGFLDLCTRAVPDDPVPKLRLARKAISDSQLEEAARLLRLIIDSRSDLVEAQAWLGVTLAYMEADEALVAWNSRLPAGADEHPQTWFARGLWAERQDQNAAAARCFWETIRRDANHQGAISNLARMMGVLGDSGSVDHLTARARHLSQLAIAVDEAKDLPNPILRKQIPGILEELGRFLEAAAWYQLALKTVPSSPWANAGLRRMIRVLSALDVGPPPLVVSQQLAELDLSELRLPDWPEQPKSTLPAESISDESSAFRFVDSAVETGLDFTFHCDAAIDDEVQYLFKFNGGGIGVIDFDGDTWPDVYLTQGAQWPAKSELSVRLPVDRLFRNSDGRTFEDVTVAARLNGIDYGQGVTVGDYDNDGFQDLYVANVTPNRFYKNMGDGTFSDVTNDTLTAGNDQTSSCVLADLNGDGLADLYVVNYVGGSVLEGCEAELGRLCAPTRFPAAQDQLYINLGNGRFEDVTETSGIVAPDGRGLGIVAADFDDSGRLSLFVANDMSANFFFVNEGSPRGPISFSERALVSGVALSLNGRANACMGVAAGDVSEDGNTDLFVTNFYKEANTLYQSAGSGVFTDGTQAAGLRAPGFDMLAFGTQFLDADLDGDLDLIIANGHVYPFPGVLKEKRMHPQFHENVGNGRFREVRAETAGKYFDRKHLGRPLARVDWNRDGRDDFIVSHLDTPVALLTNLSPAGNFVAFHLTGTESARDAIGTSVTVAINGRTQTQQLTAGDGYQCSNDRRLVFGLANVSDDALIDSVKVRWPSGRQQQYSNLRAGMNYVLVEGGSTAWLASRALNGR